MAIDVIDVSHLVKTYPGKTPVRAVRDISFRVQRGEIFGFLGPNGAGKTTAIRCMLDLLARPLERSVSLGWMHGATPLPSIAASATCPAMCACQVI